MVRPDYQAESNDDMPLPLVPLIAEVASSVAEPVTSFISGAANFISGIFGNSEDKSTTAYQNFLSSGGASGVVPPPRDEICYWAQQAGWEQKLVGNLFNTYSQADGTFTHGDWRGVVISTWPIAVKLFKGARESFVLTTTDYYSPMVGAKTQPSAGIQAASQAVSAPAPAPVTSAIAQNISPVAAQILDAEAIPSPDFQELAKRYVEQVLRTENKGENSNLGTTTQTSPENSGVPWWVWLIVAGVGIYAISKKK